MGRRRDKGRRKGWEWVSARLWSVRRGFLAARGGGEVRVAVAAAVKMAEGLERVRISASELRGILATLAPQAGSRGESRRPAPGLGLPAPPPWPPPRPVRGAPVPPPLAPTVGAGTATRPLPTLPSRWLVWLLAGTDPSGRACLSSCLHLLSHRDGGCSLLPQLSQISP